MKGLYLLVILTITLFVIGVLMVFNTTSADVIDRSLNISTHHAFIKQLLYGCFGVCLAVFVFAFGYQNMIRYSPYFFYGLVVCLLLVDIPGVGTMYNGARRWLSVGPISFQPSEFMKIVAPLYFIYLYIQNPDLTAKSFYKILFRLAVPLLLILIEPDNGTVVILIATLAVLFLLCQVKWKYWVLPACVFIAVGVGIASQMPHVKKRIHIYIHPEADLLGQGHQPYQARVAAGSGGFLGKGLGQSVQKLNYLPEARSDYIAAIYAEEFGFLGVLFLVLLYVCIAYSGLYIAVKSGTQIGMYVAGVNTFLISFQAFINLGVVSGLLPSKGTNLPFFSQGGSSLVANCICVVLIMSVCKCHAMYRGDKCIREPL